MLSDLDVSTHSDTSNGNYNVEPNLWQRNQSEVEPETEQPFPESPQPLFRTSSQQKEHEESKSIVQFIQHHIDTCSSSTCLRQLVTTAEKEDCNYTRLVRTIKNSRRFVNTSFNDGSEKAGNTRDDYLRSLLRGKHVYCLTHSTFYKCVDFVLENVQKVRKDGAHLFNYTLGRSKETILEDISVCCTVFCFTFGLSLHKVKKLRKDVKNVSPMIAFRFLTSAFLICLSPSSSSSFHCLTSCRINFLVVPIEFTMIVLLTIRKWKNRLSKIIIMVLKMLTVTHCDSRKSQIMLLLLLIILSRIYFASRG
jgi:hypothetical protein